MIKKKEKKSNMKQSHSDRKKERERGEVRSERGREGGRKGEKVEHRMKKHGYVPGKTFFFSPQLIHYQIKCHSVDVNFLQNKTKQRNWRNKQLLIGM